MTIKYLHSITLNHGRVETRESSSRQYAAVVIATATPKQIEAAAKDRAAEEPRYLGDVAKLQAAAEAAGCTVQEGIQRYRALEKIWRGPDGYWAAITRAREARGAFPIDAPEDVRCAYNEAVYAAAEADRKARGIVDPYKSPYHQIVCLESSVRRQRERIEQWLSPRPEEQWAVSWHLTVGNADKELGSRRCDHLRSEGWKLEVRTDFEIKSHEVKPRAKKGSNH